MSQSRTRFTAPRAVIVPVAVALLLILPLAAQQKSPQQPKQQYLDKWQNVPFCGSVTITVNGGGNATVEGVKWKKTESGRLTANITGPKDKVNQRTGKVSGFFVEGTVNMTYSYDETAKFPKDTWTWSMQAKGQKQHSNGPGEYTWTSLSVNKAQGLYRFRPPGGKAVGTMTYSNQGGTKHQAASFDDWHAPVGDKDRGFDPKTGIITDSDNFTCWYLIGIKDFFGREAYFCDPPQLSPSEQKLPGLQRAHASLASIPPLFKNADPARVQPVNFAVNWNLNLDTGACQKEVRIVSPSKDFEIVFSRRKPKQLEVTGYAEATPKSYELRIYPWDMDDIEGSKKQLKSLGPPNCRGAMEADPVTGPCVRFYFDGLPKDNSQFGKKTITADTAAPAHIRVFYKKFEKDNPEGKDANWYYYWKQGAVPGLEQFVFEDLPPDSGSVASFLPPDKLFIHPRAALCQVPGTIELFERLPGFINPGSIPGADLDEKVLTSMKEDRMIQVFRTIEVQELKGVDRCHSSVLHELKHKWVYDTFHGAFDQDGDELPDYWEILTQPIYQFDPLDADTHFLRFQISEDYWDYGDQEVICREAGLNHAAVHELDWASPGKQSEDKDECNAQP